MLLIFGMTLVAIGGFAQRRDSVYFEPLQRTDLKPIVIDGARYFYGSQRLKNAYSLEIPFYDLNDPEVNRNFKQFKTLRTVGSVLGFAPTVYFVYNLSGGAYNGGAFWTIYSAGVVGTVLCNLLAENKMRFAVRAFNLGITRHRVGLSVQPLPHQNTAWGIAYRVGF